MTRLKQTSFKGKLLLTYIILISIPLAISSVLIYKQFVVTYKDASSTMILQRINQEVNSINEALDTIEKTAFLLSSNITFNTFLNDEYNSESLDSFNNLNNRVIPMFTWFRDTNPNISKIHVITYNTSISEIDMFIHAFRYESEKWFVNMKEKTRLGLPYWETNKVQRLYRGSGNNSTLPSLTYSLFCTVEPVYADNTTYLEFQVKPGVLYSTLNLSPVGKSGYLAVLDREFGIMTSNKNPLLTSLVQDEIFLSGLDQSVGEYNYTFENKLYKINYQKIQRLNTFVISIVPTTEITELFNKSVNNYIYSIGIMLFFLLILAYYLGNLLTKKIKKITTAFQRFQEGDFETRIEIKGNDELDNLGADFNIMALRIHELINKVYKAEIAQKQAELSALQSQIKPHFIYNTLESLKMTAELHDEEEISDGLTALGNLIRQNTYTENHLIPIETEIDNLIDYIKIQNRLHNNKIKLNIDVPEGILLHSILNLVLQPMAENCIKHGFREESGRLEITVQGEETDSNIYLTVSDNGKGIQAERLDMLHRMLEEKTDGPDICTTKRGIGLLNVNRRIQLYFGDRYGVQIKNGLEKGALVIIKIPALTDRVSRLPSERVSEAK